MTKSEEKAFLRQAVSFLGVNSYCGIWLGEQLPAIEFAIDSDYPPESRALSFSESRKLADETIRAAKEQAAAIEKESKEQAEKLILRARNVIEHEKEQARQNLRRALSVI
jgi:hypothetical protein